MKLYDTIEESFRYESVFDVWFVWTRCVFYTNLTIGPLTSYPALEIGPGDGVIVSRVQDGGEDCFRLGSNYRRSSWRPFRCMESKEGKF